MKKVLVVLLVVGLVTLLAGCNLFSKTYHNVYDFGEYGWCAEVTTSDADTIKIMEAAESKSGPCPSSYASEPKCTYTNNVDGARGTFTVYYKGMDADEVKSACDSLKK